MQTFKQFILEDSAEQILKDIPTRCGKFLMNSEGLPLYRGDSGGERPRVKQTRKYRMPLDTDLEIHTLLDDYFEKKLGVRLRSEALFATGTRHRAEAYGKVNFVFPIGDYKYFWGSDSMDKPIVDTGLFASKIYRAIERRRPETDTEKADIVAEVMDKTTWHTNGLAKAIANGAEISMIVDSVILVPANDKYTYEEIITGDL